MILLIDAVERFSAGRDRALNAYRTRSVETASPGELVLMLYNEALRCMRDSIGHMKEKNFTESNKRLLKAQDIIDELRGSLNLALGGDIAKQLASVYDFAYTTLLSANVKKDPEMVENVLKVVTELRDGWEDLIHRNA
ncbi:MAG TPA: flagellar export chaperone FliS [Firmicutes bacterium]|nr:flagellar export chaperone FliS [Candidatus Fermentithermobacillaceae bacterium]